MDAKTLKLHLLGRPLIELGGEPVDGFVSEKALALLGYLAVQAAANPAGVSASHSFKRGVQLPIGLLAGCRTDRKAAGG